MIAVYRPPAIRIRRNTAWPGFEMVVIGQVFVCGRSLPALLKFSAAAAKGHPHGPIAVELLRRLAVQELREIAADLWAKASGAVAGELHDDEWWEEPEAWTAANTPEPA